MAYGRIGGLYYRRYTYEKISKGWIAPMVSQYSDLDKVKVKTLPDVGWQYLDNHAKETLLGNFAIILVPDKDIDAVSSGYKNPFLVENVYMAYWDTDPTDHAKALDGDFDTPTGWGKILSTNTSGRYGFTFEPAQYMKVRLKVGIRVSVDVDNIRMRPRIRDSAGNWSSSATYFQCGATGAGVECIGTYTHDWALISGIAAENTIGYSKTGDIEVRIYELDAYFAADERTYKEFSNLSADNAGAFMNEGVNPANVNTWVKTLHTNTKIEYLWAYKFKLDKEEGC